MAEKTVTIRKNRDGTYTIRVGRQVEHISTEAKSKTQIFDAIRYAIMSKGVYLSEIDVATLMYDESN